MPFRKWRHVFKLDPDRSLSDDDLFAICTSGTDAVIIGGSSGVDYHNTEALLLRLQRYEITYALEISSLEAAVPGFDHYFIPVVLNTTDVRWLIGEHLEAVKQYGDFIPWDIVHTEGYIILNEQAEAARVSNANTDLTSEDVVAYAKLAERIYRLPIIYIEYSGTFGKLEWVEQVASATQQAHIFYGGGIDGPEKARRAAAIADTVIVGNAVYENLEQALHTVEAVKSIGLERRNDE